MSALFGFFLRLFICFVAAKFFLVALGLDNRQYLLGLTALLTANVYWLSYLTFRDRQAPAPGREPPGEALPTDEVG